MLESLPSKPDKRASENARFRLCDRADAPVVTALGPRDVSTNGESQYTLFSSGVRFAATHRAVAFTIRPPIHFYLTGTSQSQAKGGKGLFFDLLTLVLRWILKAPLIG